MGEFSAWHLLILAGVFVLLFGAKRLPDGARSLGRSLRIFKTEVKGLGDDDPGEQQQAEQGQAQQQQQLPPAAPTAAPTGAPTTAPTAPPADAVQQQHETR